MRLAALSVSALLLTGCSWMGNMGGQGKAYQYNQNAYAKAGPGHFGPTGAANPCTIYSPVQPVPTGCHPSQVVLAGQHGQSQTSYTTGGYGSHASSAYQVAEYGKASGRIRKPRLRGTVSFGTEQSVSGNFLEPDAAALIYNSAAFQEGSTSVIPGAGGALPAGGNASVRETILYDSVLEGIDAPAQSFNDVHQSPLSLKGGVEYILNPKFTLFANAGYTHAVGANDVQASVISTLNKTTTTQEFDPGTGVNIGAPIINTEFIPNVNVANFTADISDLRKYDLEIGARKYFKPIYQDQGYKTITPFVGAAVGVSHVNDVTFKTDQNQLFLGRAFEGGDRDYYDVPTASTVNTLYESDWLVNGALTTGLEWQLTPKTALAFETGLKAYQSRDFVSGDSGDMNVVVPLTLRGSYNF